MQSVNDILHLMTHPVTYVERVLYYTAISGLTMFEPLTEPVVLQLSLQLRLERCQLASANHSTLGDVFRPPFSLILQVDQWIKECKILATIFDLQSLLRRPSFEMKQHYYAYRKSKTCIGSAADRSVFRPLNSENNGLRCGDPAECMM